MLTLASTLLVVMSATNCVEAVKKSNPQCETVHRCRNEAEACRTLAFEALNTIAPGQEEQTPPKLEPTSSDVQPARPAAKAGASCMTTSVVPSVETLGTGGACLQATGGEQGTQSTVSVTLNPLGLATLDNAKAFAKTARLTDLTLVLPVSTATSGKFPSFVGVRANFDVVGLANGAATYDRITQAYNDALQKEGDLGFQLRTALDEKTRRPRCVDAVANKDAAAIERDCGVAVTTRAQQISKALEVVRAELAAVRQEIDNKHGGLHIEADIPLKNLDQTEIPLRMVGQLLGRIRGASAGWSVGLSGGLGASYVKPQADDGATAFIWRLSLTADAGVDQSAVHATVGFSGNAGKRLDETLLPLFNGLTGHFTDMQVLVSVPLTSGTGVTASVSWPISRDNERHGATFSISFDGAYLLGPGAGKGSGT